MKTQIEQSSETTKAKLLYVYGGEAIKMNMEYFFPDYLAQYADLIVMGDEETTGPTLSSLISTVQQLSLENCEELNFIFNAHGYKNGQIALCSDNLNGYEILKALADKL